MKHCCDGPELGKFEKPWSDGIEIHEWPSPHSSMLMSEVKAEAVRCLQVGFSLFKHRASTHLSVHPVQSSSSLITSSPVHISHHLEAYHYTTWSTTRTS